MEASLVSILACSKWNGFWLADSLHRIYHYSPDADLVAILDSAERLYETAYAEKLEKWIREKSVEPFYSKDDPVVFRYRGEPHYGTVVGILRHKAAYVIFSPELGHVSEGTGVTGQTIDYEDVLSMDMTVSMRPIAAQA